MDILPSALETCIHSFRPLLRVEVFETFYYLLVGLLIGEAKSGAVRASVFAPADYQPARISDFFTTHRVSPQALMEQLTALILRLLYGRELPGRLFWIADSTQTEKPHAEKIAALGLFHRSKLDFVQSPSEDCWGHSRHPAGVLAHDALALLPGPEGETFFNVGSLP